MSKEFWDQYNSILIQIENACKTKNIVGDYAEELVANAYNGTRARNSQAGYDVSATLDGKIQRIQVKATRQNHESPKGNTSDFHNCDFDILVPIVFNGKGEIVKAVKLDAKKAKKISHARNENSHSISWGKLVKNGEDIMNIIKIN